MGGELAGELDARSAVVAVQVARPLPAQRDGAVLQVLSNRSWHPTHHFEHVVDTLVAFVRSHGGEVLLRHTALEYLREGRTVVGVRAESPDGIAVHRAPLAVYASVKDLDLRQHGFGAWNVFHTEDPDLDAAFRRMQVDGDYARPSFAITTPTPVTPIPDAPPGHQVLQLLTVADHRRWTDLALNDPRAYARRKKQVADQLLEYVERNYVPGLRDALALALIGSPTTSERYVRAPAGNSYGSALIPANLGSNRLDPHTSLDRFWFCNASSGYAGFAGTVWTGCSLYERLGSAATR